MLHSTNGTREAHMGIRWHVTSSSSLFIGGEEILNPVHTHLCEKSWYAEWVQNTTTVSTTLSCLDFEGPSNLQEAFGRGYLNLPLSIIQSLHKTKLWSWTMLTSDFSYYNSFKRYGRKLEFYSTFLLLPLKKNPSGATRLIYF